MDNLLSSLYNFLVHPIFDVGGVKFSFASIASLTIQIIVVFIVARIATEIIRRSLLSRLGLNRGLQEAVAVSIKYSLTVLGIAIVLQTAGINLSSLTVVVGVLGIGIGFGLQNLASNFISGLVLLFEQTIKVGDYIEINGLQGTIEKISIRSTIVRTNDDVFVIVPNQRFIENDTVNWSYGGHICRIHLPVGVAYGTDPLLLTEALLAAARSEPRVISYPPPEVWFKGFGNSSLDFQLLVWVNNPNENEPIKSALNFRVEYELRQRGIEIPYPHRDLRIRNIEALRPLFQNHSPNDKPSEKISDNGYENGEKKINFDKPEPTTDSTNSGKNKLTVKTVSKRSLRDLLRRVSYFERCTDTELLAVIASGFRQHFTPPQVICKQDDPSDTFYIILSGSVEIISERTDTHIATLHHGEFFGEIALLTGTPRTATVRALTDTTLFVIGRRQLQKLLTDHKELGEQIALKLSERQQILINMGLLNEEEIKRSESAAITWVRDRLNTLFGIQLGK
ncbi:cyclic nucleotide-binding domain-containing protein [Tumidithrix elongata RA019]|uniref:Cyclic nucleotide-binding domain-containing protein n=1 Tax=Tumidithrix elongata BACA0141 TaxID=2716417 RepID=A0AAW9PXQ5_9CYAN|nr:cyclic nucleotide-binding domain-containing protein [Tumidithrix elongata RA019]